MNLEQQLRDKANQLGKGDSIIDDLMPIIEAHSLQEQKNAEIRGRLTVMNHLREWGDNVEGTYNQLLATELIAIQQLESTKEKT